MSTSDITLTCLPFTGHPRRQSASRPRPDPDHATNQVRVKW
ncbi:hypothetical protein E2C01_062045 [Portunus trituberculatus]|uniref:Uncharacterized protein n=1 Tax=Portunus trituberculatus TaxID=210409 RepID=A0A5B7HDH3_PORTR|nr:hypothetical protein [Portunus trituberculatus]